MVAPAMPLEYGVWSIREMKMIIVAVSMMSRAETKKSQLLRELTMVCDLAGLLLTIVGIFYIFTPATNCLNIT
jgi:hypothetical protein